MLDRRNFLEAGAALATLAAAPCSASAYPAFVFSPGAWRVYEIRTIIEIASPEPAQVWAPAAALDAPGWSRPLGTNWTGNADFAELAHDPVYGAQMVHLRWRGGAGQRRAEIVSRVATSDRSVPLAPAGVAPLSAEDRALFLRATSLIPTDGIIKETSVKIVAGAATDLDKAQAIYAWLVANTERFASTPGCGSGDIRTMLASDRLGGKCADINGLFVGLARAAGLPARDLYGIRVAPSRFGYISLGAGSANVTKAQHCRADVGSKESAGRQWSGQRPQGHAGGATDAPDRRRPEGRRRRKALIGGCEGNWIALRP